MAKAGRKRKAGCKREKNGRASRAGSGEAMLSVVLAQPHRAGLPDGAARDQRAASALGQLFLRKVITEPEFEAGERLAAAKHAFSVMMASPAGMRSASGQMVAEPVSSDDWERVEREIAAAVETEEDRRDRVLARWSTLESVVWGAVGCDRLRFGLVMRVACEGICMVRSSDGYGPELDWLRSALRTLAAHLGLDEQAEETGRARGRMRVAVDGCEIRRETTPKAA